MLCKIAYRFNLGNPSCFPIDLHNFRDPSSFSSFLLDVEQTMALVSLPSSAFHQILMIYKQILSLPQGSSLKGILSRSKAVACKVNNHLLIDLVYEVVYWVSASWTHTVGVAPLRFPWQPHLVWKKLGGLAYTPRKGEMKLPPPPLLSPEQFCFWFCFYVSIIPSSSCLWKGKGPLGRVTLGCGDGGQLCVWVCESKDACLCRELHFRTEACLWVEKEPLTERAPCPKRPPPLFPAPSASLPSCVLTGLPWPYLEKPRSQRDSCQGHHDIPLSSEGWVIFWFLHWLKDE